MKSVVAYGDRRYGDLVSAIADAPCFGGNWAALAHEQSAEFTHVGQRLARSRKRVLDRQPLETRLSKAKAREERLLANLKAAEKQTEDDEEELRKLRDRAEHEN